MSIMIDGKEFASHEIRIVNDRPTLVVTLGPVAAPVINGVEYPEFEYRILNGQATLSVPFGGELPTSRAGQLPFEIDFSSSDELELHLDRMLADIADRLPERTDAPVVDISVARAVGPRPTRKSRDKGPSRTKFTPRPLG